MRGILQGCLQTIMLMMLSACLGMQRESNESETRAKSLDNACLIIIKSKNEVVKIGRRTFEVGAQIDNGYDGLTYKLIDSKTRKTSGYSIKIIEKGAANPANSLLGELRMYRDFGDFLPQLIHLEADNPMNPEFLRIVKARVAGKDLNSLLKVFGESGTYLEVEKAYKSFEDFQNRLAQTMAERAESNSYILDITANSMRYDGRSWVITRANHLSSRRAFAKGIMEYFSADYIEVGTKLRNKILTFAPLTIDDFKLLIKTQTAREELLFKNILNELKVSEGF